MGLRKQLFIVAFSTLLLPWAGCQYVQEMEGVLRENQSTSLMEQSQMLVQSLANFSFPDANNHPVFYTPLRYQMIDVDGYADDWQYHTSQPIQSLKDTASAHLQSAVHKNRLYLFLSIKNPNIQYHHPGFSYQQSNHIRVLTKTENQHRQWVFFTSGPGALQVYQLIGSKLKSTQTVTAWWEETHSGFNLEISIPQKQILTTLDIGVYLTPDSNINDRTQQAKLAITTQQQSASYWLKPQPAFTSVIAMQRRDDRNAVIVDPNGWPLSEQRDWLTESIEKTDSLPQAGIINDIISRFYRFMINVLTPYDSRTPWPFQRKDISSQQYRLPLEKLSLPSQQVKSGWYQIPDSQQSILLSIEPIYQQGVLKGYLMLSKTGDGLISLTNQALRRVTHRALLATLVVIGILILFASTLSWRIRKLKQNAENAISLDGKITVFTPSKHPDEVGDLSRSYYNLLEKVRHYTDYLETLNSKLAHELRTPLAIVKSSLELAQQGGDIQVYLQRATEGSERLRKILSAMSEASRVEYAIQHTDFTAFSIHPFLKALWTAYSDTYPKHDFCFTSDSVDGSVLGSPDLLAQLLDKLVENARSFAPLGSTITLHLSRQANIMHLTITNQGPLLPTHLENQLFDSLISKRDNKEEETTPHLGLGLYIARLICQAHNGNIEAHNLEDESGVYFLTHLPVISPKNH